MRWVGICFGVLSVSAFVTVARAEPLGARGAQAELPIGIAAFPVEASGVAQVHAVSAPAPAAQPPAAQPAAPAAQPARAAPLVVPAVRPAPEQVAPSFAPAPPLPAPSAVTAPSDCPRSTSTIELGAAAIAAMIRDGKGLFAVLGMFGDSSDEKVIDDAAEKEVRRLRLVHRLAEMQEQESEREFTEKLAGYLRKRAFLEGLEASRQLAPSPFGPAPR